MFFDMFPKKSRIYKSFAKDLNTKDFFGNMSKNQTPTKEIPASKKEIELEVELAPAPAALLGASSAPAQPAEDLEVELEELPPPSSAATAVTTQTPRNELVPVYLLAMHLPSPDIIADDYTELLDQRVRRVKEWRGDDRRVAREIETMRRSIYRRIERLWCMVREFGVWITVTDEGIKEAEIIFKEVREKLHQLGLGEVAHRYFVRAIRVYLEPIDAKILLNAAVAQLSAEVQELERRIKDAETAQNRRQVRELMRKKHYVKALFDVFKKYIEEIGR
jgi:hypothetical protein